MHSVVAEKLKYHRLKPGRVQNRLRSQHRGLGSFSQLRQFRDRKTYELSPFLPVGTDFAKDVGEQ